MPKTSLHLGTHPTIEASHLISARRTARLHDRRLLPSPASPTGAWPREFRDALRSAWSRRRRTCPSPPVFLRSARSSNSVRVPRRTLAGLASIWCRRTPRSEPNSSVGACGDIPPRFCTVVDVQIADNTANVWLLTNDLPRFERYQVTFTR